MQIFKGKSGGILAGLAAGALWGLVFVAPRMILGDPTKDSQHASFSGVDLMAGRYVCYGLVALVLLIYGFFKARISAASTQKLPTPRQGLSALGLSLLGFTGYYWLLVLAINTIGAEMPALITGTIPLLVMFFGKFVGKQHALQWRSLLPGLLLTAAGLLLMAYVQLQGHDLGQHGPVGMQKTAYDASKYWLGIALAVASMLSWTVFTLANSIWLNKHPEVSATDWTNWLGVATGMSAVLMWWALGSDMSVLMNHPLKWQFVLICIAIGVGAAWLGTVFWNIASQRLSASLCGQLIVSETVFALIYSSWWEGQMPPWLAILASVLFVLGILASIKAHR